MAIDEDSNDKSQLQKLLGKRLKAARKAAKKTEMDVARILEHREQTQISLWETGDRMPPLVSLKKLAIFYAVPLDWLVGIHDDPIADPVESNLAMVVNIFQQSMTRDLQKVTAAMATTAAVTLDGFNTDRQQLKEMCELSARARKAFDTVRKLNEGYDDDCRGGNQLNEVIRLMELRGLSFGERIERERQTIEEIDTQISHSERNEKIQQLMMVFTE